MSEITEIKREVQEEIIGRYLRSIDREDLVIPPTEGWAILEGEAIAAYYCRDGIHKFIRGEKVVILAHNSIVFEIISNIYPHVVDDEKVGEICLVQSTATWDPYKEYPETENKEFLEIPRDF